ALFRTEAHPLAFHLGRPVRTLLYWEELDRLSPQEEPRFVVMPADVARSWPHFLRRVRLEEVAANSDGLQRGHEKPLVLFRIRDPVRPPEGDRPRGGRSSPSPRGTEVGAKPPLPRGERGEEAPLTRGSVGARRTCPNFTAPRPTRTTRASPRCRRPRRCPS